MTWWTNEKGERLYVAAHELVDCRTLHDEHPTFCLGGLAWVPCSERMPERGQRVIWTDGETLATGCVSWERPNDREAIVIDQSDSSERDWIDPERVTHWMPMMPLPQPPRG